MLQVKRDLPLYLTNEQEREANDIIELYKEEDIFSGLSDYLKAFEESAFLSPYYLFLSALMDEHFNRPAAAIQNYLRLAEHHPDPLLCFKKAEELVKKTSDPFALPHFLEKLDRNRLIQLRQTTRYPEDLEKFILQKDAVRMTFEKCLAALNQHSSQTKAPNCFICFNVEEADVGRWIEQVLVPDLDQMGIQPLFCFKDLNHGEGELNNFQGLIRRADQVMIVCTPDLKRKCKEREKNPVGVAQEIHLVKERYNDADKYGSTSLLYLKGTQKESCPSEFFEPILGIKLNQSQETSILNYYEIAFELFGGMRNIPREISRKIRKDFLLQANKIFTGKVNQEELEKLRQVKQSQIERISKEAQERVTKMTQMVHPPLPPKDFTGRQQELQDLHRACQHHYRVAITGLGGVGKTALALRYVNKHQTDYQFVYLIPAGTSRLIKDGLLQLADDLHLPKVEEIEERLELLKRRLDRLEQKYLLIFDGIDQVEAFDELTKYLPERGNCLLLTSRMPEQSRIRNFEIIELRPFSPEDAVNYLLNSTSSEEEKEASKLAEYLGRLPLALAQAAMYIYQHKISIHEYIQEFNQYQLKLFEHKRLNLLTGEEKTILTTWNISLNAIETVHKCPLAKELMAFFAFLGQASIPFNLVKEWFETTHSTNEDLELIDALKHLCDYSVIDNPSPDFFQVNPLVQQVTHFQMTNPQLVFDQTFMALTLQIRKFQQDNVNTWNLVKPTVPHALSLLKRQDLMANMTLEKQCEFMGLLGNICSADGNFYQALEVHKSRLKLATEWHKQSPQLQETNIELARSYNDIGSRLEALGKYDEALEYHRKALEILLKANGENHLGIALSYNNIGMDLRSLEKYNEALDSHQKALNMQLKVHGEDHPDVARSYSNIGLSLQKLEKCVEALDYHRKALNMLLKVYGEDHPLIARSYNHIGESFSSLGSYAKALKYHRNALGIQQKVYGKDHPDVARSYNDIGESLNSLRKYDEALEHHLKALEIRRKVYGKDHPDVAKSYHSIGWSLEGMGKYQKALDYFQKALEIRQKVYGEEHPDIALSYNNIGATLMVLGKFDEVLGYHQKALKILLKIYGEEHSHVAATYNHIGAGLNQLGKHEEALGCCQKALRIQLKVFGEEHADVATSYNSIGLSLQRLGRHDEALKHLQKGLKIILRVHGKTHPHVGISYNNIGVSLDSLGNYNEALKYHQKALKIIRKVYGEDHPAVATSCNNIGTSLQILGEYNKALELYQKALQIFEKFYPPNHPELLMTKQHLTTVLNNRGKNLQQIKNQSILEKILDRYDVSTKEQALRRAAFAGNIEDMKYLIEKEQVDINSKDPKQGMTALHWAVKQKNKIAFLWLLQLGASLDIADAKGKKPKDYDQDGLMN